MRSRITPAIAFALLVTGCATGGSGLSPSGSAAPVTVAPPPDVDANCDAIQPSHTPACDRVRAEATDLDDQIAVLERSLDGPPRPTGPERADIMRRIHDLEVQRGALGRQLATCDGRNKPRRQLTADVRSVLTQVGSAPAATLTVAPLGLAGFPPDGVLSQSLSGQEFVLLFTESGCTVRVIAIPAGRFKKTGVPRDLSLGAVAPATSGGKYHPVTGDLDLHIETTLTLDVGGGDPIAFDLTTRLGGGRNVDGAGNVVLVSPAPRALDPHGNINRSVGVETVSFRFEGLLSARPPR